MSETLAKYRALEERLRTIRLEDPEEEWKLEDDLLDSMEKVWYQLTTDEQELLRKEGPTCWPVVERKT